MYKQPTRAWKLNATEYNKTQRMKRRFQHTDEYREKSNFRITIVVITLIALFIVA